MRALLVDSRPAAAQALRTALRQEGFTVVLLDDHDDVASFARREEFDAILLVAPPGGMMNAPSAHAAPAHVVAGHDAAAYIRALRRAGVATPTIVVGTGGHRVDTIPALRAGADDVVNPPVSPVELGARCAALVRRARGFGSNELTVGDLTLDPEAHAVRLGGRQVHLTAREFDVLRLLVLRRGQAVRKGVILSNLYAMDADEPDGKIIDVFVCKLRRKLAQAGGENLISTVWGVGYRFDTPADATQAVLAS